jgi:hypothetical protein
MVMMRSSFDEIRLRIDDVVQRLQTDEAFQAQMQENPEGALISAGLGEEAAVILADDWRGAMGGDAEKACEVRASCRFSDSKGGDNCGWTATSLRCPM